jgi:hypothetical protein
VEAAAGIAAAADSIGWQTSWSSENAESDIIRETIVMVTYLLL